MIATTDTTPRFSIIIPAFNAESYIETCVRSCLAQDIATAAFEIIIVDDHSSDRTRDIAVLMARQAQNIVVANTVRNLGPGPARNLGVSLARGAWLVFLDCDDSLTQGALSQLAGFLDRPENAGCDAISFNREPDHAAFMRRLDKVGLIGRYLRLHMDGSVIFTAIRRDLLRDHFISFAPGYHEDVDFLFFVYWHARRVGYLDAAIYRKQRRAGSIVETMTERHIDGFVRAWSAIGEHLLAHAYDCQEGFWPAYNVGTVGVIATRVREISRLAASPADAVDLYESLYAGWGKLLRISGDVDLAFQQTVYFRVANLFLSRMAEISLALPADVPAFQGEIADFLKCSWSCQDLHHSVFLAPDQIRTCSKRFFADGEIRGDVVLIDVANGEQPAEADITAARAELHRRINRGDITPCSGCPFLQFREWGPIKPALIQLLSLEYHSVCNLHCTYCSETYYGGRKPRYDVRMLLEDFINKSKIDARANVVWGGGEPVIDRQFASILDRLAVSLPQASQRILTNAVTYSTAAERWLGSGAITLTTSLDAGTNETFNKIRGRDKLTRVICNLRKYSSIAPSRVTIKYIFMQDNESVVECRAFVARMLAARLLDCNFQISVDFKQAAVAHETLASIAALHGMLVAAGCRVVFADDLMRQRLVGIDATAERAVRWRLEEWGVPDALIDVDEHPDFVIWGAGWQAQHCLEKANFFKRRKPAFLVDSTPSKIGGQFMGFPVRDPASLLGNGLPVMIAAVQGYPAIYDEFIGLGLSPSRLVTKLVV